MRSVNESIAFRAAAGVMDEWDVADPVIKIVTEDAADALSHELLVFRIIYEGWCPGDHPLSVEGPADVSTLGHDDLLEFLDMRDPAALAASRLVSVVLQSNLRKHSELAMAVCQTTPGDQLYQSAAELACNSHLIERSFRGLRPHKERWKVAQTWREASMLAECAAHYLERVGVDEMGAINYFAEASGLNPSGLLGLDLAIAQGSIVWAGFNVFAIPVPSVRQQGPFDLDLFMTARSSNERELAVDEMIMALMREGRLRESVPVAEVTLQDAARRLSSALREAEQLRTSEDEGTPQGAAPHAPMSSLSLNDQHRVLSAELLYEVLGVHSQSSRTEIRQAFRDRSKELHPDLNEGQADHDELARVSFAWEILGREDLRAAYDWKEGYYQ